MVPTTARSNRTPGKTSGSHRSRNDKRCGRASSNHNRDPTLRSRRNRPGRRSPPRCPVRCSRPPHRGRRVRRIRRVRDLPRRRTPAVGTPTTSVRWVPATSRARDSSRCTGPGLRPDRRRHGSRCHRRPVRSPGPKTVRPRTVRPRTVRVKPVRARTVGVRPVRPRTVRAVSRLVRPSVHRGRSSRRARSTRSIRSGDRPPSREWSDPGGHRGSARASEGIGATSAPGAKWCRRVRHRYTGQRVDPAITGEHPEERRPPPWMLTRTGRVGPSQPTIASITR